MSGRSFVLLESPYSPGYPHWCHKTMRAIDVAANVQDADVPFDFVFELVAAAVTVAVDDAIRLDWI